MSYTFFLTKKVGDFAEIVGSYFNVTGKSGGSVTAKAYTRTGSNSLIIDGTYQEWEASYFSVFGKPRALTIYEGRLVLGNLGSRKSSTVIGSSTENPFFFNNKRFEYVGERDINGVTSYRDEISNLDPFVFSLSSSNTSINWLEGGEALFIGATRGLHIGYGTEGGLLGPLNVSFNKIVRDNVDFVGLAVDEFIYFPCNRGTRLRRMRFNFSNGSDLSQDLSVIARDVYEDNPIVQMAYSSVNKSIFARGIGSNSMTVISISPESEVLANSTIKLPEGVNITDITVSETSGAISFRYMKVLNTNFVPIISTFFPFRSVSFRDYLQERAQLPIPQLPANENKNLNVPVLGFPVGEVIWIIREYNDPAYQTQTYQREVELLDGEVIPTVTIPPQEIESVVYLGKAVESMIKLMPVEAGQQFGSAQSGIKRVDRVVTRYYKSYSYVVGEDSSKYKDDEIIVSEGTDAEIGIERSNISASQGLEQVIFLSNSKPEPLTVLSMTVRGVTNDG